MGCTRRLYHAHLYGAYVYADAEQNKIVAKVELCACLCVFLLAMTAFSAEMMFHYALLLPMMSILMIEKKRTLTLLLFFGLIGFVALSFLNNHIQRYDRLLAAALFIFYGVIAFIWKQQLKYVENQARDQALSFHQQAEKWNEKLTLADQENQRLLGMIDNEVTVRCRHLLGFLNDVEREDIKLHVKQGMTLKSIAKEVHRSTATIKSRRQTAGKKLEAEGASVKELENLLNQCSYYQINRE